MNNYRTRLRDRALVNLEFHAEVAVLSENNRTAIKRQAYIMALKVPCQ